MTTTAHLRRALPLISAVLLLAAAVVGPAAQPAYAASATITCTGSSAITYNPGLLFTVRSVHYTETDSFSTCVSTESGLTAGGATAEATLDGSCLALPLELGHDPAYTVRWNTKQTSTLDLMFSDAIVGGTETVTAVGTVTAGVLAGATATIVWVYPVLNPLQCLANPGITQQNGTLVATLILL